MSHSRSKTRKAALKKPHRYRIGSTRRRPHAPLPRIEEEPITEANIGALMELDEDVLGPTRTRKQTQRYGSTVSLTRKMTFKKGPTAGQRIAALLARIRGKSTKTQELREILAGIQNKQVLSDARRKKIENMIKERGRLMSQQGYIKYLEGKAKSEAERAAVAAQQAHLDAQEAALAAHVDEEVDELTAMFGSKAIIGTH